MANDAEGNAVRLIDHGPAFVGLTVFALALWAQVGDAYVGRFIGDGLNLVLAKALARGDGLSLIHFPGTVPARWVYPFYPAVVSLVGRVWSSFPDNVVLIQILDSALLGFAGWIVARQTSKLDFPPVALYVSITFAFLSGHILALAVSAFPEPLFLAVTAAAVLLADRDRIDSKTAAGAGVLAGAAALTSPLGVSVVLGIVVALVARKAYRPAAVAVLVAAAVALPWFFWSATRVDDTGLAAVATSVARQAADMNGAASWQGFGPMVALLLQPLPQWIGAVLGTVAAGFVAVGVVSTFARAPAFVTVLLFCMLGAWIHPDAVARNEWILFPWFVVLVAVGAWRAWGYNRKTRIPVAIAATSLMLCYAPRTALAVLGRDFSASLSEQNEHLRLLVQSINSELDETAILASDAEAMVHLYTGHYVIPARLPATASADDDTVRRYCDAGVTYLVSAHLAVPDAIDDNFLRSLGRTVTPVFELTGGPAVYQFTCPD